MRKVRLRCVTVTLALDELPPSASVWLRDPRRTGDSMLGVARRLRRAQLLGLPKVRRLCLLIVDGLGWELLRDHPGGGAVPVRTGITRAR